MNMTQILTKVERFMLRWVARRLVVQSPHHKAKMTAFYRVMREAARKSFYEDNKVTLDSFLQECFDDANKQHDID